MSQRHRNIREGVDIRTVWADTGKVVHSGTQIEFVEDGSCTPKKVRRYVFTGGWARVK